jgi:hypothetical protein
MDSDTATQTAVCIDGMTFYVLNANSGASAVFTPGTMGDWSGGKPFIELPGGTHAVLDGIQFGRVTLEDIVNSSYMGYQLNGNKNGYQMPALSQNIDSLGTQGDLIFENGIQTPGFFNLPICTNIYNAIRNIGYQEVGTPDFWPCIDPYC